MAGWDSLGTEAVWTLPLTWIPEWRTVDGLKLKQHVDEFNGVSLFNARRRAILNGSTVAFAPTGPGSAGETSLTTQAMSWKIQQINPGQSPDRTPFLPMMERADVEIPAINHLLGQTGNGVAFGFGQTYLDHGFPEQDGGPNQGEVFATILPGSGDITLPPDKAGGLARPTVGFDGLSRILGPVGRQADLAAGHFDPASVFPDSATLLGSFKLNQIIPPPRLPLTSSLLRNATGQAISFPDRSLDELPLMPVPLLMSRPRFAASAANGSELESVETWLLWKTEVAGSGPSILKPTEASSATTLALRTRLVHDHKTNTSSATVEGRLTNFAIEFMGVMRVSFTALTFTAKNGRKPDVSAEGVQIAFMGPLTFVNELRKIIPDNGWSDPPELTITPEGIASAYSLALPTVGIGIFSLQNLALSAHLSLPFVDRPAGVRFAISERHAPFIVTVGIFGGGGFFALALNASGIEQIEASIEFGGNISLNLGVASGGVCVMAGIYFNMVGSDVKLSGYLRCGGALQVLGLICISVEFFMQLTYDITVDKVTGRASLTVCVEVLFFSKSLSLTVERKFGGSSGDPSFADFVDENAWKTYCDAFAA